MLDALGPPCLSSKVRFHSLLMKLELRFTKSGRKFTLWQLLFVIVAVGVCVALLPDRVGIPLFLFIEGTAIVAFLFCLAVMIFRDLTGK